MTHELIRDLIKDLLDALLGPSVDAEALRGKIKDRLVSAIDELGGLDDRQAKRWKELHAAVPADTPVPSAAPPREPPRDGPGGENPNG